MTPSSTTPAVPRENVAAMEKRRIHSLRMQMVEAHPFWGYLLLQVHLVPALELSTFAATDCLRHIWYNPNLTRHLDNAQLGFVLAHEVGHQLLESMSRKDGRDHHLWNCATDYAINRMVDAIEQPGTPTRSMYRVPEGTYPALGSVKILLDRRFAGMVAESIYEVLLSEQLPSPRSVEVRLDVRRPEGGDATVRIPRLEDHRGGIDVHLPGAGLSTTQQDQLAGRIVRAADAFYDSNNRGSYPGDLVRSLLGRHRSKVPWQRILHSFAGEAMARDEWTLARPNLRYLDQNIVVPGPWAESSPSLVLSVDSSGSMTGEILEMVSAELKAVAALASSVTIVVSDARVQQVVEERDVEGFLRQIRFRGGGGTDHRPVFDLLRLRRQTPDLFIGLSDLYTVLPDRRPPFPVLWVAPPTHGRAPWGKVIEVGV
jgi:predicted metal-dependent peptidase